jgi:dUTPase
VACGIKIALPEGVIAIPITRSSAVKRGIMVFTTLIDTGYRGPIFVFATTTGSEEIDLQIGDSIAQLLPLGNMSMYMKSERVLTLPDSERGERGFGSSGGGAK